MQKNCQPPDMVQLGVGLVVAVISLLIVQRWAPQYSDIYLLIIILGLVLGHADCWAQFIGQVQALAAGGTQ